MKARYQDVLSLYEVIRLTNVSKTFQHKTAVKDLWSLVLKKIRDKISKPSFETWLANTNAKIEDDVVIVRDSNSFGADWLDSRYKGLIFETVKEVAGKTYVIEICSLE